MRTYGMLIAIVALGGTAWAQPGNEPAAVESVQPPENFAPAEPPQAPQPAQPPAGSAQATFASSTAQPWEVLIDRNGACVTPCSLWVAPGSFVTFRSMEQRPVLLDVGHLPPAPVVVTGKHLEQGKYAAGVTFTALSGISLVTGITLVAVGYGADSSGMRTAGFISGGVGAIGLYLSIQLMRAAAPSVNISPAGEVRF